jgi:hypothetical protein
MFRFGGPASARPLKSVDGAQLRVSAAAQAPRGA